MKTLSERLAEARRFGMKPGLETIRAILARLGNPQDDLKFVHIAGTNGKGATAALVDAALCAAGYRTGRYTSPHLVRVNERFFVNGAPVEDEPLAAAAAEVEQALGDDINPTFFEYLTAVAFVLFKRLRVQTVVLETGLGGRLDATNVIIRPLVSVITRIGLDHCDWLGGTHAAIAEEKAGIVKPGCPVVVGAMPEAARDTIARAASLSGCRFVNADEYVTVESERPLRLLTAHRRLPPIDFALPGHYQLENAATALTALDVLTKYAGVPVADHAIVAGFASVVWPGRFQKIVREGVTIIVDGAHNPDGARALRESLTADPSLHNVPLGLIAGFCGDKDVLQNLRILSAALATGWAVPIANPRSLAVSETAERMQMAGFSTVFPCESCAAAIAAGLAWAKENKGALVICGSLFLAGEALVALKAFPWQVKPADQNESISCLR